MARHLIVPKSGKRTTSTMPPVWNAFRCVSLLAEHSVALATGTYREPGKSGFCDMSAQACCRAAAANSVG